MRAKRRLLDLYCCEGGASTGYARAGFEVYGVDLFEEHTRARYPFPAVKMGALDALQTLLAGLPLIFDNGDVLFLDDFDVIVASPPCQHATAGTRASANRHKYPRLIGPTRELLIETGKPYVIENVSGADLREPVMLCGSMFGLCAYDDDGTPLEMQRHRLFESNVPLSAPHECKHGWFSDQVAGAYGGARRDKHEARHVRHGGYVPSKAVQQVLLGIDWMTVKGMHQSIPPAYTQHIGEQILAHLDKTGESND